MSNSGRKMSTPGWRTFARLGGVLVVAFGAFAIATPQNKSEAALVPAAQQAGGAALIDQAGVVAVKPEAANGKQNSSLATSTAAAAGPSLTRSSGTRTAQAAHDFCNTPDPAFDGSNPFSTAGNSTDGAVHAGCQFDGQTYHDNWYVYQATCTGSLDVTTCEDNGGSADYDTDLVVYDGRASDGDFACPPGDVDLLGCNDDNCSVAFHSFLTVPVTAGSWYTIRVGGWNDGDMGSGDLLLTCAGGGGGGNPACNDDAGDCCSDNGTPGCNDDDCCNCICNCDPFCCDSTWDTFCSGEGFEEGCGASLPDGLCADECSECLGGGPVCGDGNCDAGENSCNCQADCPGPCGGGDCTVFTNQAEFEAFNEEEGKTLKGIEDFEEVPPGGDPIIGFDDPLCGGIPSNPPIFPNGIDQLNLCVQSNNLAGEADVPDPDGENGLVFVEFGAGFGESSDIVLANNLVDSFDLIFGLPVPPDQQDNHTGVGFDPVGVIGGDTVAIRVFDKDNVEMVSATSPVDPAGSNFWGVWCPDTIGRINIFDPDDGAEGADNIQLWFDISCDPPCVAPATCVGGSCCGDGVVEGNEECDTGGPPGCGTCPTDVNHDDETGAFDLAVLLGSWGDIPEDADPEIFCLDAHDPPDDNLGPFDLAVVLGSWGCCCGNQDPKCDPVPPDCDGLGGGDGECKDSDCLENCQCVGRGACCGVKGDPGACDADLTEDECDAAGGNYAGDDTTCDDCPDPACFDADGSCFLDHGGPGCCQSECCAIVCMIDPVCCEGWDDFCVGIANENCAPSSCGDGCCDPSESKCNCNQDCEGECPFACTVFNNQAEFEAFNEEEGKALKGVEDFEEGTLPPNSVAGMDDPLCGGIPSLPPGSPYPNGLDQLNMCVQSNILGEFPATPAPAGINGLAAASNGFAGALSDVVICDTFVNSLDMMFTSPPAQEEDDHTGIGFNTITLLGGNSVHIQVFNKANQFLIGALDVPVVGDSSFWGVWCADPIGRINVFDPGNGAEGGDNIQLWVQGVGFCGDNKCTAGEDCENCPEDCGACPVCGNGVIEQGEECDPPGPGGCGGEVCLPDCTCGDICGDGQCGPGENECNCNADCPGECVQCTEFNNQAEFEAFNEDTGKFLKDIVDYEEMPPGTGIVGFDDPLCGGVPNGPFPNGLLVENFCIQSNLLAGAPVVPSPHGANGLVTVEFGAGFGESSDLVLANYFAESTDLMFGDPVPPDQQDNHTGIGFDTVTLLGGNSVQIRVYDKNNIELLSTTSPADTAGTNFWGVWCPQTIGRLNIFDPGLGAQTGDNIQLWKDVP